MNVNLTFSYTHFSLFMEGLVMVESRFFGTAQVHCSDLPSLNGPQSSINHLQPTKYWLGVVDTGLLAI